MEAVTGKERKYVLDCHWVKQVGGGERLSSFLFILPHGALRREKSSEHVTWIQEAEKKKSTE